MSFETLGSRLIFRGQVVADTGLHIGTASSSLSPSATDSPVILDSGKRPLIPGSSFKGALRSHLESIIRGLGRERLTACDPHTESETCIPARTQNNRTSIDDLKDAAGREATEKDETGKQKLNRIKYDQLLASKIFHQSCTICHLFGSPFLAACLMVRDLSIIPESFSGRVELRDGVGIDRDTETARQGIKYDFEVVAASSCFDLEIVADNANDELIGLLAIGLREMEQQRISLGGKTTRGLGCVTLRLTEIEVMGDPGAQEFPGTGSAELMNYLITGKGKLLTGEAVHNYLRSKISALATFAFSERSNSDAQETS